MIYLFCALWQEAAPLVRALDLKKNPNDTAYQRFGGEDLNLVITGPGKTAAACCVGYTLREEPDLHGTHLVNFGSAGGKTPEEGLYLIRKIRDPDTDRCFYPDLLLASGLPERGIETVSRPAAEDAIKETDVLFDMEASAVYEAGAHFLGPHQLHFLKFVSDSGEAEVLPEAIEKKAEAAVPAVLSYLRVLKKEEEMEARRSPVIDEETLTRDAALFHASQSMKEALRHLLTYAALSGMEDPIKKLAAQGILPAADKKEGKRILDDVFRSITE